MVGATGSLSRWCSRSGSLGSLSRWCSGSLALTRTGRASANIAIAIAIEMPPHLRCYLNQIAVATSPGRALLNLSDAPQAWIHATTWTQASPSGRIAPRLHEFYIGVAGIGCAWSAKGHFTSHLAPKLAASDQQMIYCAEFIYICTHMYLCP